MIHQVANSGSKVNEFYVYAEGDRITEVAALRIVGGRVTERYV